MATIRTYIISLCAMMLTAEALACASTAPDLAAINLPSYYSGAQRADIDLIRKRSYDQAISPFVIFRRHLLQKVDAAILGDAEAGACATKMLSSLSSDFTAHTVNTVEGQRRRAMLLSSLAVAWYKLNRVQPPHSSITQFFLSQAEESEAFFRSNPSPTASGNLRVFSVLLSSATNAVASLDQAKNKITLSSILCRIDADGSIPTEAARGRKADDYHLFSARALAASLLILGREGISCLEATDRLARRVANFTHPEVCFVVEVLSRKRLADCRGPHFSDVMLGGRMDLLPGYLE